MFISIGVDPENEELTKPSNEEIQPLPTSPTTVEPTSVEQTPKYSNSSLSILSIEEEKEIDKENLREEEEQGGNPSLPGRKEAHEVIDFFSAYTKTQIKKRSDKRINAIIRRMKEQEIDTRQTKIAVMWQYQSSQEHCKIETIFVRDNPWIFEESKKQAVILEKRLAEWEENQSIPEE